MTSSENRKMSFEKGLPELIQKQRLFSESIFAQFPIGIEIYDSDGVLRCINDHALRMYGVDDRETVVDKVNLFDSPYVDEELLAKIKSGEEIVLEFEYDFDQINRNAYFASSNTDSIIYQARVAAMWGGGNGRDHRPHPADQRRDGCQRDGIPHGRVEEKPGDGHGRGQYVLVGL